MPCDCSPNWRVSPGPIEHMFNSLGMLKKIGPAGALTPVNPGLTTNKEWMMTSVPERSNQRRARRPSPTECPCEADHIAIIQKHIRVVDSGCWEWTRSLTHGYGVQWHEKYTWRAHRLSYFAYKGSIGAGLVIDHLCRNKACVNPGHLEAVTNRENVLRGDLTKVRRLPLTDDDPRHGTLGAYSNAKCRCQKCRDTWAEYCLKRKRIRQMEGNQSAKQRREPTEQQSITLKFLRMAADDLAKAKRLRLHYMRLGREYGLTNQEIGDALGVTEVAARRMLKRAIECRSCMDSVAPGTMCSICGLYDSSGGE